MAHDIGYYLARLQDMGASDLHLASGSPTLRVHGTLQRLDEPPLMAADVQGMVFQVLEPQKHHLLAELKNLDFAYESGTDAQGRPRRYRGNVYLQKNGPNLVMRSIPSEIPTLEKLGLPRTLEKLTHYHQGLVLVTGQAGSGKTSTLAALINLINQHSPHHIITIEDPIEYVFTPARALVNQRQVGRDVESFQLALKGALREDPDVIMVGELRDLETISLAITAAETGHLVFGTLHTNSAAKTVDRLIDAFPVDAQAQIRTMLSESLKGVISQQLIPRKDGTGRAVAVEILIGTGPVANLIREGKTHQINMMIQTGKKDGMRLMDDSLLELYQKGIISREEAMARSVNKDPYKGAAVASAEVPR